MFGDQIRQKDGKIIWRNDLIREAFTANKPFAIRLGEATPNLLAKLPSSVPKDLCAGKPLVITQDWLSRKRKDGTDHCAHFQPLEMYPNDVPLTIEDLELLPEIWRNPDKVEKTGWSRLMLSMKASGGAVYKAGDDCGCNAGGLFARRRLLDGHAAAQVDVEVAEPKTFV